MNTWAVVAPARGTGVYLVGGYHEKGVGCPRPVDVDDP